LDVRVVGGLVPGAGFETHDLHFRRTQRLFPSAMNVPSCLPIQDGLTIRDIARRCWGA
jgi:hypothetical protein